MANNELKDFADIAPLGGKDGFKKLEYLVLTGNPIASQKNYRLYVIHLVPSLRVFATGSELFRNFDVFLKIFLNFF